MRNRFSWGIVLLLGLALFCVGCQVFGPYQYKGRVVDPPIVPPNFTLTRADGQPFHLSDVRGDIALVYFGYTYCPDVCPLTMGKVKQALAGLDTGQKHIYVLFISVDPERDTPEVLSKYMAAFGPQFIGLRGDFDQVSQIMKPFGAFAEKQPVNDPALGYLINHTAYVYLVNPQGQVVLIYPFEFTSDDLRSDLTYLLQQENTKP